MHRRDAGVRRQHRAARQAVPRARAQLWRVGVCDAETGRSHIEIRSDLDTKFISQDGLASMFHFPKDLARRPVEPNRLTTAVVSDYYRSGWSSPRDDTDLCLLVDAFDCSGPQ